MKYVVNCENCNNEYICIVYPLIDGVSVKTYKDGFPKCVKDIYTRDGKIFFTAYCQICGKTQEVEMK